MKLAISLTILAVAILLGLYRSVLILHYFHPALKSDEDSPSGCPISKFVQTYAKKWYIPITWLKWFQLDIKQEDTENWLTIDLPTCLKNPMDIEKLEKYKHVSLLGQVYDVSTYPEMYGIQGGYNYLTGTDATREFANNGQKPPDIRPGDELWKKGYALQGLTTFQLEELINWMAFFNAKYNCVGYIVGPYYDPMGEAKPYLVELKDTWEKSRKEAKALSQRFPKCNSFAEQGKSFFSCSPIKLKTGKEVKAMPRNLLLPTVYSPICVCVPESVKDLPAMKPYANCPLNSAQCQLTRENNEIDWASVDRTIRIKL